MWNYLKIIYKLILPVHIYLYLVSIRNKVSFCFNPIKREARKNLIAFLDSNPCDTEKIAMSSFLKDAKYSLPMFPYDFTLNYDPRNIKVFNSESGHKYVLHEEKKLFFPASFKEVDVARCFCNLIIEQDERSPHCYSKNPNCIPSSGDVIADIGAAEGIWALTNIEHCSKAYLFECDARWIDALNLTFAPWKEKVEIVHKYVGNSDANDFITLDTFFCDKALDCIKADIEGAELEMLVGGRESFKDKISKAIICAYHHYNDDKIIAEFLARHGYDVEISGYLIPQAHEEIEVFKREPYKLLRRGVVWGWKN